MGFIRRDYWLIDDHTGKRIRRSQAVVQWDGIVTSRANWDPKHPLEYRLKERDVRQPELTRPEPEDIFIDPLDPVVPE